MSKIFFIKFKLFCDQTKTGETVNILGSLKALGNWDVKNCVRLKTTYYDYPLWQSDEIKIEVNEERDILSFQYKYLIQSLDGNSKWEKFEGNRQLDLDIYNPSEDSLFIINGEYFNDIHKKSFVVIQTREQIKEEHLKIMETEEYLETSLNSDNNSNELSPNANENHALNKDFNLDKYLDELIELINELKHNNNQAKFKLKRLFNSFKGKKDFDKELLILIFLHFLKTGQFKYLDGLPESSEHHYHFDPILSRAICTYLASNINEENSLIIRSLLTYIPACTDPKGMVISHKDFI